MSWWDEKYARRKEKWPPEPEVPKHHKKSKKRAKRFGIEVKWNHSSEWMTHAWYFTVGQRDQAFNKLVYHRSEYFTGPRRIVLGPTYRKVSR